MKCQELLTDGYERILEILEKSLDGLTQEDLNLRLAAESNSIGWLAWHVARELDYNTAALMGAEQLWVKDEWHASFGRSANPMDTGFSKFGHSPADAAAFVSPDTNILLAYLRAALERMKGYIDSLSAADLDRKLGQKAWSWERRRRLIREGEEEWYSPEPTLGMRLVSILSECLQHAGQIGYARGILKGRGWLKE